MNNVKKLKILTWHIHGSYLYYLSQANCEFFIPYKEGKDGYGKVSRESYSWGDNIHEIPVERVKDIDVDVVLFQSKEAYLKDQYTLLSKKQQSLPKIYLEHDPPREVPTDTKHVTYNDTDILVVHVTHFNQLMWDNGLTPTVVIEHGITDTGITYKGDIGKGIVVINNIKNRGRRLGFDIFLELKKYFPIDIVGINSEEVGGLGDVPHNKLLDLISHYRFFLNPIRYTSCGLSMLEAMSVGLPVIGLATTELPTIITNNVTGFLSNNMQEIRTVMMELLHDEKRAAEMGKAAKREVQNRFSIQRFTRDWERAFSAVLTADGTNLYSQALTIQENGGAI